MTRAMPFLTFQPSRGQSAAEAMKTYVELFSDGCIITDQRYGPDGPGPEGTVVMAEFVVAGQHIRCSDSFVEHEWNITPGTSIMVDCDSTAELERLFASLGEGGRTYMPLDDYGFGPFGWVEDRFGVSWQLGVPRT